MSPMKDGQVWGAVDHAARSRGSASHSGHRKHTVLVSQDMLCCGQPVLLSGKLAFDNWLPSSALSICLGHQSAPGSPQPPPCSRHTKRSAIRSEPDPERAWEICLDDNIQKQYKEWANFRSGRVQSGFRWLPLKWHCFQTSSKNFKLKSNS